MANIESKINGLIMSVRKEGRKEDVLAYQAIKA